MPMPLFDHNWEDASGIPGHAERLTEPALQAQVIALGAELAQCGR
jgi:hypothetical protein